MQNYRILIVDDVSDNLFFLQTLLEDEGYSVETAESGKLALEKIKILPQDIILLDVMMPDMNGYEVHSKIRQKKHLIPILFITGSEEPKKLAGGDRDWYGFIQKPLDCDELLKKIKYFLRGK